MIAALGGIDALIFSAGIGENSSEVRAATCSKFEHLRLKLDSNRNQYCTKDGDVAATESVVRVLVVRAQEDWAIAQDCWKLTSSVPPNIASAT
jgi:acetate kinase